MTRLDLQKWFLVLLPLVLCASLSSVSSAQTFSTLHSFDAADSQYPYRGLVQGIDGNLYGTTYGGVYDSGEVDYGTVFKVTPSGTLTTLHTFCLESGCPDGANPDGWLVQATNGDLYGTTYSGGADGGGTVFRITPGGTLTTLHSFAGYPTEGSNPTVGLLHASNGDYYGTTYYGGTSSNCGNGCGTVFKITPSGALTTTHSFDNSDGDGPNGGLVQATNGDLYGITTYGGANQSCDENGCGTAFKITPSGTLTTIYSFCSQLESGYCDDGYSPNAGLVQASNGDLYGTTFYGGCLTCGHYGTAFKMTVSGTLTTLATFDVTNGANPSASLIQGTDGNLYGTTYQGGTAYSAGGTAFKLTLSGALTTLYSFCTQNECADGQELFSELVQDTNGSFYGVTVYGGANSTTCAYGCGTVFSLSTGLGPFIETKTTSGVKGASVIILGTNLTGATSVSFNGTTATFKVVSGSEITTTVPTGAKTGTVSVETPSGTLKSNLTFKVTPQITTFTPASGDAGTSVKITGTELTQTTKVTFGGVKASDFTVNSDGEVTATVPTGAKTGKIAITTPGGTATSATSFTVTL